MLKMKDCEELWITHKADQDADTRCHWMMSNNILHTYYSVNPNKENNESKHFAMLFFPVNVLFNMRVIWSRASLKNSKIGTLIGTPLSVFFLCLAKIWNRIVANANLGITSSKWLICVNLCTLSW